MQQRELVETKLPSGRTFVVNVAESPLSWLRARNLVDARQFAPNALSATVTRAVPN